MKYEIDIPVILTDNYPATVQVGKFIYHLGLKAAPVAPKPCTGKRAHSYVADDIAGHDKCYAMNPDMWYQGIPLKFDPLFMGLDDANPDLWSKPAANPARYRIGGEWLTKNGSHVRVINQHTDLDYEVTVVKAAYTPEKGDESRGTRAGSSYIVDSWGKVKRGALAPGFGMDLAKEVETTVQVGKSVSFHGTPVFSVAQHAAITTWIAEAVRASRAEVATDLAAVRADIRPEIDQAIKAYDASRLKVLVGKTYVTRNGSQVKIVRQAHDGSTNGQITRGGTARHGFKAEVFHDREGKSSALTGDSQLDLMHEVIL